MTPVFPVDGVIIVMIDSSDTSVVSVASDCRDTSVTVFSSVASDWSDVVVSDASVSSDGSISSA